MSIRRALAGVVALALSTPATVRVEPAPITIRATVTDKTGRFVDDLTTSDFVLTDNGKKQSLAAVRPDTRPLLLVLALDRSGSFALISDRIDAVARHVVSR